jgi:hypothetical protein
MFPLIMHIKQEDMERNIREDVSEPSVVIRDDKTACKGRVSSLSLIPKRRRELTHQSKHRNARDSEWESVESHRKDGDAR